MADPNWFERAFGRAVADIRQKVVEEMWFGRAVTPRPLSSLDRMDSERSPAERLGWDVSQTPDRSPNEPNHGIDRDR